MTVDGDRQHEFLMSAPMIDPIIFRIPRAQWLGDAVAGVVMPFIVTIVIFTIGCGIVFGGFNGSDAHLFWIVPLSVLLGALLMLSLAKGRFGKSWRLSTIGIERGRGRLTRVIPYENVRLLAYEKSGRETFLRIRFNRTAIRIFLAAADLQECFDSLCELCPHAGAIDQDGVTHEPKSVDARPEALRQLLKEWRRRKWQIIATYLVLIFGGSPVLLIGLMYYFPNTPTYIHITKVVVFIIFATVGSVIMTLRVFREIRRTKSLLAKATGKES